jgi:hypothetical protein
MDEEKNTYLQEFSFGTVARIRRGKISEPITEGTSNWDWRYWL